MMGNVDKLLALKKSKLLKNGMWLFVLQVFNTIVPMVTLPFITRILGSSGYGDFSIALNWVLYFQVIVEYGFAFWGSRKVAVNGKDGLQETFSKIITSRLVLMVFSYALLVCIFFASRRPLSHLISMSILFLMVLGVAFQMTWLFQGMQNMKYITLINAAARTISVLLVFVLIKKPTDVYLYCLLYSITYILAGAVGLVMAYKLYGLRVKLCGVKEVIISLKEAWPLFISQAMSKVLSGFGITVLGMFATNSIVGIYSAVYKIPYAMTLFFAPLSQAIYPDVSVRFGESREKGIARVKKLASILIPLFASACVIIIVFNHPIIHIIFGEEYSPYSGVVVPLCLWFVFSVVNNFLGIQILVASGHQKEYSNAFLISALISIALNLVLGKIVGLYGIAYATLLAEIMLSGLLLYSIKKTGMVTECSRTN